MYKTFNPPKDIILIPEDETASKLGPKNELNVEKKMSVKFVPFEKPVWDDML